MLWCLDEPLLSSSAMVEFPADAFCGSVGCGTGTGGRVGLATGFFVAAMVGDGVGLYTGLALGNPVVGPAVAVGAGVG